MLNFPLSNRVNSYVTATRCLTKCWMGKRTARCGRAVELE